MHCFFAYVTVMSPDLINNVKLETNIEIIVTYLCIVYVVAYNILVQLSVESHRLLEF